MLINIILKFLIFKMLISIIINDHKFKETINKIIKSLNNIEYINRENDINNEIFEKVIHKVKNVLFMSSRILC